MEVYVIIPARNEAHRISRTLEDYSRLKFRSGRVRIVVV